jgi:hypothetical protein
MLRAVRLQCSLALNLPRARAGSRSRNRWFDQVHSQTARLPGGSAMLCPDYSAAADLQAVWFVVHEPEGCLGSAPLQSQHRARMSGFAARQQTPSCAGGRHERSQHVWAVGRTRVCLYSVLHLINCLAFPADSRFLRHLPGHAQPCCDSCAIALVVSTIVSPPGRCRFSHTHAISYYSGCHSHSASVPRLHARLNQTQQSRIRTIEAVPREWRHGEE